MSPVLLADAAGPIAPSASPSGESDRSINGLSDRVSDTGPWVGDVPSEYAIPTPPADWPPETVVDAFRPDEATAVVPHPRYPEEPSSLISYGPSPVLPPTTPTAGNVGSLFGLYPYSSTSFRRNSSASFLALRFRHRKRPAMRRRATTTIGTTTATAMVPPVPRPLLAPLFDCCGSAVPAPDVDDDVAEPVVVRGKPPP